MFCWGSVREWPVHGPGTCLASVVGTCILQGSMRCYLFLQLLPCSQAAPHSATAFFSGLHLHPSAFTALSPLLSPGRNRFLLKSYILSSHPLLVTHPVSWQTCSELLIFLTSLQSLLKCYLFYETFARLLEGVRIRNVLIPLCFCRTRLHPCHRHFGALIQVQLMFGYFCPWRFSQDTELLGDRDPLLRLCPPHSLAPTCRGKYSILEANDIKRNILLSGEGCCSNSEFILSATPRMFWPLSMGLFL